jgi:hypothetical protein
LDLALQRFDLLLDGKDLAKLMPLGGLESGFLSHAVGVPWTTAGALICAGAGLWTWWVVRRNPTTPREPE